MVPLSSVLGKLRLRHSKAGKAEIPLAERTFPTFRMAMPSKQGEILYWWFWYGSRLRYVTELDETQKKMPLREVMSADDFLDHLLTDS